MSQITTGLRGILSSPTIYNVSQWLLGSKRSRVQFVEQFVRPEDGFNIMDIGCGTARILQLINQDISYWGYDISQKYIDYARKKNGEYATFKCALIDESIITELPDMNIVLMLGVLHHLNDGEAKKLLTEAKQALGEKGRLVTIDPVFSISQSPIAKFLISRDRGENVRFAEQYTDLTEEVFSKVYGTMRHKSGLPYTHWIMECYK